MNRQTKVECDYCGKNLTYTTNATDYRVVLRSEMKERVGGVLTQMLKHDPLPEPRHFCGLTCLHEWLHGEQNAKRNVAA